MSDYELTLVLKTKAKVEFAGKLTESKDWGVKELAYPIRGQKQGFFVWNRLALLPEEVREVDRSLKTNDNVLRYLLIKE